MTGLISIALSVIAEGLKIYGTAQAKAHIMKVASIQQKIDRLEAKAYDQQDDAEIVETYKEARIWIEAAREIQRLQEAKA